MTTFFKTYWSSRKPYALGWKSFFSTNRTLLLFSFFTFLLVLLLRSWFHFTHPGLYVEDTSHYFNYFYGDMRGFKSLFHNPNGYITILTNTIALLTAKLDVRIQPAIYLMTSATMTIATVMALPCSGLLKNRYILFCSPFLLGLSGANHLFYYTTLTYLIYVSVILLFSLLFWETGDSNLKTFLLFIFLSLLVWSGPFSVLIIPFSLLFILFFKGKTRLLLGLVIIAILYLLCVTDKTIMLGNILHGAIRRIWFNTLILNVFLMEARHVVTTKIEIFFILFFTGILFFFRRDSFYLKIALLLFTLINGSLALLFLSKKYLLYQTLLPCYLFIPQFFWLFFLLFTADRFLGKHNIPAKLGIPLAFCFFAFILYDNVHHPEKWKIHRMPALPRFLEVVHSNEMQHWEKKNKLKIITTPGRGSFRPTVKIGKLGDNTAEVEFIHVE